jgi:hypothetical protein
MTTPGNDIFVFADRQTYFDIHGIAHDVTTLSI